MNQLHTAAPVSPRFLVYWQHAAGRQLFAFTAAVDAPTPQAARDTARRTVPRNGRILGVKQSAGSGLCTLHRGRWLA